jgi:hypothetical protein
LTVAKEDTKPQWPPTKEDLERLYVEHRLSAARIARIYGLEYASPKTAESTILHHLKRNGIERRDRAEHIRKVTEGMVDEWAKRYQAGESLKKIAGTDSSPVTVFYHLTKRGIRLRDKVAAQIQAVTKHEKRPFAGTESDKWYLIGFALGDLDIVRHGRAIRARTATTHPAMADLFRSLFGRHGFVHFYPRKDKWTGFEWSLEVDLDNSFEFLYFAKKSLVWMADKHENFLSFLAGFIDAEGTIYFHHKTYGTSPEIQITNTNAQILDAIREELDGLGYHPHTHSSLQDPTRLGYVREGWKLQLSLFRQGEVLRILTALSLRHGEKREKALLALRFLKSTSADAREEIQIQWNTLTARITEEREMFVLKARDALSMRSR